MTDSSRAIAKRAFTRLDLVTIVVVILVVCALFGLVVPMLGSTGRQDRPMKDFRNVHDIGNGMYLFAQSNKDQYPLPSLLDAAGATINAEASTKDTTANIISMLIYAKFFAPPICVSPLETNVNIVVDVDFESAAPSSAANPKLALWDPSFSADFTRPKGGNLSYALMLPSGPRLALWTTNASSTQAILGTRGPLIAGVTKVVNGQVTPRYNRESLSMRRFGSQAMWQANVAYNDGGMGGTTELWDTGSRGVITYTDSAGIAWPDLLHYDEPDDKSGLNNYLGIFTTSGKTPQEFNPIWD